MRDDRDLDGDGNAAAAMLYSARLAFEVARDALTARAAALAGGEEAKGAEVSALLKETAKALTVAVEQAQRLADHRRQADGGGGFDLEAARGEIGRRLDRLRAARVSG